MRIAIVLNTAWNIANFRMNLIRSLIHDGHEVVAIAPIDDYVGEIEKFGVRFLPISMSRHGLNPFSDAILFLSYSRLLRREEIEVVLAFTVKPNIYATIAARVLGVPIINNISGLGTAFIQRSWLTWIVKNLYRYALKSSAHIFFQNTEDRDLFLKEGLVTIEKTSTIPGSGLDTRYFSPEITRKTGEKAKGFVFLLIARLLWDKGIREYVQAAKNLKDRFPEVYFQLIGGIDEENPASVDEKSLEVWINDGIIEYLGHVKDVRPFIGSADCIVLPSYREGLPRVLLEAGAMAKLTIATNVEGCRDVIDHGITGFLCEPKSHKFLIPCMERCLLLSEQERIKMGYAAREKVKLEFDEKIVIDSYLDILNQVRS